MWNPQEIAVAECKMLRQDAHGSNLRDAELLAHALTCNENTFLVRVRRDSQRLLCDGLLDLGSSNMILLLAKCLGDLFVAKKREPYGHTYPPIRL
jgi:hypothetical protein